jgi:hypothetical protein
MAARPQERSDSEGSARVGSHKLVPVVAGRQKGDRTGAVLRSLGREAREFYAGYRARGERRARLSRPMVRAT